MRPILFVCALAALPLGIVTSGVGMGRYRDGERRRETLIETRLGQTGQGSGAKQTGEGSPVGLGAVSLPP